MPLERIPLPTKLEDLMEAEFVLLQKPNGEPMQVLIKPGLYFVEIIHLCQELTSSSVQTETGWK